MSQIKYFNDNVSVENKRVILRLDLNVPMLIPENYVKDLTSRLSLYRELALLKNDEELNKKKLFSKLQSKKYTIFRHYLNLERYLNN